MSSIAVEAILVEAAASAVADGQGVVIQTLDSSGLFVSLEGPDIPEQGVEVGSELRAAETWYPGAAKSTIHIMGTKEMPIELRGWFNDSLTSFRGGALENIQTLRKMQLGNKYCQLNWGQAIVKYGFIKDLKFEFHRESRVRYTISFLVQSSQESSVVATPIKTSSPFNAAANAVQIAKLVLDQIEAETGIVEALPGIAAGSAR